ncbi:DinB family protein [Sphingomonas colocasiae]|uniref:DinB family protein n=1 Tax=Sphingomonas colocasiae TaxID=1848973 RepID=A0ABS7PKJ7_9SPHN|nr:DinB family protein [Sphingomonas colocasiae]MBY8821811.1 DinB family protein [Sphingomonas colocasiae]
MFSHISVGISDLDRAALFYDALLTPLGLTRRPVRPDGGPPALCWHKAGSGLPRFYACRPFDGEPCSPGNGVMVAFHAPSGQAVKRAYAAGMAHGGRDEGAPGPRDRYGPGYFGAYLRDPDGNKIHIVHRADVADAAVETGSASAMLRLLMRYKAWANEISYRHVMDLPEGEAERQRATRFGNIVHTLNHLHVVDEIFRAHLEGRPHGHVARNTDHPPPLADLWAAVQAMDRWYIAYADRLTDAAADEMVDFRFVDGGRGAMTRAEMLLHVVNHASYHRGFVSDMLYQLPSEPPANDLPVFLRDAHRATHISAEP